MQETKNSQVTIVAFELLTASPMNVRKVLPSEDKIHELAKNIEQVGILQNLLVYPTKVGKSKKVRYAVAAGNRRYLALTQLHEEGKIASDYEVPVQVIDEEEAISLSTVENEHREPMHIYDQIHAFKAMVDAGKSESQIADKFGYTPKHVQRILKIANVSPKLTDLLLKDQITLEQLQALAIVSDHERQESVWFGCLTEHQQQPRSLRNTLMKTQVSLSDSLARFIGLQAYEAAGGEVVRDLFADESDSNSIYLSDVALLEKLCNEKLRQLADEIQVKEGWLFADIHCGYVGYYHLHQAYNEIDAESRDYSPEENKRLAEIDKRMTFLEGQLENEDIEMSEEEAEKLQVELEVLQEEKDALNDNCLYWPKEVMESTGVLLYIRNGEVQINKGLQRRVAEGDAAQNQTAEVLNGQRKVIAKEKSLHGEALMRKLSAQRTVAIMAELANNTDVAVRMLTFNLASCFITRFHGLEASKIRGVDKRHDMLTYDPRIGESEAMKELDRLDSNWQDEWSADYWSNLEMVFSWPMEKVLDLLGFCVAISLDGVVLRESTPSPLSGIEQLMPEFNIARWWQPTAENYFKHLSKDSIFELLGKVVSPEKASKLLKMKKGEAALAAEKLVEDTGWMPDPMIIKTEPEIDAQEVVEDEERDEEGEADDLVTAEN